MHPPVPLRSWTLAAAAVAFELKLDQPIQRDRDWRMTLHVDAVFADVPRYDGGEACGPTLILPGQTGRQRDVAAVAGALGGVGHARVCIKLQARAVVCSDSFERSR